MLKLFPFERTEEQYQLAAKIWNAAAGEQLAVRPAFFEYNTRPTTNLVQEGKFAWMNEQPVGIVLVTTALEGIFLGQSWVDVLAVHPEFQRQGIGSRLLLWAEEHARSQNMTIIRIAGSVRPFAAGVPLELNSLGFFRQHGYDVDRQRYEWDVARSITDYRPLFQMDADIRPLRSGEEAEILTFLEREFPGRWLFEVQEFFREGGRAEDFMVLRTDIGVDGFCWMTFEDSARPLDRFYMHGLSHPWGQLGPLGVGKGCRGKGLGGALIEAAILHLKEKGIDGSLIDWTSLLDLYGKFGYQPFRQYQTLRKEF